MQNVLHVSPRLAANTAHEVGLLGKIVLSLGAGVHEELVFRLLMIGGLLWLGDKLFHLRSWVNVAVAFLISSALFSAAHHVIGGEPWALGVFTYRLLCGLVFATLFQVRGFAVAVYTHALYDVFVLVLHG
jgi:membrane protease YdiL (CAAX protease family)